MPEDMLPALLADELAALGLALADPLALLGLTLALELPAAGLGLERSQLGCSEFG